MKDSSHLKHHSATIKTEASPFSKHHFEKLRKKLSNLTAKTPEPSTANKTEEPHAYSVTCASLQHIDNRLPGELDSHVKLFEDWHVIASRKILKDREEFSLKVRKYSQIKLIINSRFRRLPLTLEVTRARKKFLEVYVDFNRFPDRDSHSLMSSDDKLLIPTSYSSQVTDDFSIRLTVYFYGDDEVTLLPHFQIQLKPYCIGDLKWTGDLYNYSQYFDMQIHPPKQRKKPLQARSAPQHPRTVSPPTTHKTFTDHSPKRLDTASTKARITFTDKFRASSAAPTKQAERHSDLDTRIALFDKTSSTFYSAHLDNRRYTESAHLRAKSPGLKTDMESIKEQRENTSAYFFFKKKQDAYRERVADLDKKIESAQSKRQEMKDRKKQTILKSLEFKLIRAQKTKLQLQGLLSRCVQIGALRGWVQNLYFFRSIDLFAQLVQGRTHRNKLTNRLYTTVMFYLRLKRRLRYCRSIGPAYQLGQAATCLKMAIGLSDGNCLRRVRGCLGRLLAEVHRTFNLRRQFQTSFIRMTEIKVRFKQHMHRKGLLRQAFLSEISKFNSILLDRSGSLSFEYYDVTWKYQNQLFEMFFNRRLNEKLAREVRKVIANRAKNRLLKRPVLGQVKFQSILDNMENSQLFESRVNGQEHYRLFELILYRLDKEIPTYQDLVKYLVETNSSPTSFNRSVKKVRALSRMSILNPAVIFDSMVVLNKHQINLQFSAAQYLCMLASMVDYNNSINKRSLIKRSSTLQD